MANVKITQKATTKLTMVMTASIPKEGVANFKSYEDKVIPILQKHGGTLERRLSNVDGTIEIHILSFNNQEAFEGYCYDPKRLEHTEVFDKSGAQTQLIQMDDVTE